CFSYEHAFLEKEAGVLYPKLAETLAALAKRYPLFIVSNCQAGYIELFLKKTGFGEYFRDFTCPGDTGEMKAENIMLIAKRNKLNAPVYVGDTQLDADACAQAGVRMVYASYGFGIVKCPDYVINTPSELLGLQF
ncbi:MAG TPA: HAD-IA family hydrolase, partial [Lachnospiraceae bacterium]|nr:HAD-IA family hydrolase [Lachnospiraceae bacterium]